MDVFRGQEVCQTNFTVAPLKAETAEMAALFEAAGHGHVDPGVGNRLKLLDEDILANVRKIQLRNGLPPSETLGPPGRRLDFTIEMETGTGKTYVSEPAQFIELYQKYGFSKFIIVVPSIAIKEVRSSLSR